MTDTKTDDWDTWFSHPVPPDPDYEAHRALLRTPGLHVTIELHGSAAGHLGYAHADGVVTTEPPHGHPDRPTLVVTSLVTPTDATGIAYAAAYAADRLPTGTTLTIRSDDRFRALFDWPVDDDGLTVVPPAGTPLPHDVAAAWLTDAGFTVAPPVDVDLL